MLQNHINRIMKKLFLIVLLQVCLGAAAQKISLTDSLGRQYLTLTDSGELIISDEKEARKNLGQLLNQLVDMKLSLEQSQRALYQAYAKREEEIAYLKNILLKNGLIY